MKIQTFQSVFAQFGEACLVGEAAERLPKETLRMVSATCAAKGGPERMTLNDWREAEDEIKRKLNL
jgi:hypothetical protein